MNACPQFSCYGQLMVCDLCCFAEKVHFQHTAKFISRLISEKGNYSLQVTHTRVCRSDPGRLACWLNTDPVALRFISIEYI